MVFVLLTSLMLLLVTCDEETSVPREYPRITGIEVTNISDSGVTFIADLYSAGSEKIIEHGFTWGDSKSLDPVRSERVFLGIPPGTGKFKADIRSSLNEGGEYFVRPFVQTEDRIVVGPVAGFSSLGSNAPVITGFSPDSAMWGDTITISGKNFSWLKNDIFLNDVQCDQISATDKIITARVSQSIITSQNVISVSLSGNKRSFTNKEFKVILPRISGLSISAAYWTDTVTIRGSHFGFFTQNYLNFVKIGDINCPVAANCLTDSTIKIIVPLSLNSIENQLTAKINNLILGPLPFILRTPFFNLSQSEGTWGSKISVKGRFYPDKTKNSVSFGGINATINQFSKDSMLLTVPAGLRNHENQVKLISGGYTAISPENFILYGPEIESISPVEGRYPRQVTIKGMYLYDNQTYNFTQVRIGTRLVQSFNTLSDSLIRFNVPSGLPEGNAAITIYAGNQNAEWGSEFTVKLPIITECYPLTASFGDTITLTGRNLFNYGVPFYAYFGDFSKRSLPAFYITDSVAKFMLPGDIDSLDKTIRAGDDWESLQTVTQQFLLKPHEISGISPVTTAGQEMTITGKGFNPDYTYNDVYWNYSRLTVKSATADKLIVQLPSNMPNNDANIIVKVGGYKRFVRVENNIQSKWSNHVIIPQNVLWSNSASDKPGGFVLNGTAYFIDHNGLMVSFDPMTMKVEQTEVYSLLAKKRLLSAVCRDTAYIILENDGLYRFDPSAKTWTIAANCPASGYYGAFFSTGDKLYYGITHRYPWYSTETINNTLWVYDPDLKKWSRKCNYPETPRAYVIASFSIGNKGYVLHHSNLFYEYDPSTDTWLKLAYYPTDMEYLGKSAMVINDKVYVGLGKFIYPYSDNFYEYDKLSNSWTPAGKIPFGGRHNAADVVINNKGYIFGGVTANGPTNDLFEFDPELP